MTEILSGNQFVKVKKKWLAENFCINTSNGLAQYEPFHIGASPLKTDL